MTLSLGEPDRGLDRSHASPLARVPVVTILLVVALWVVFLLESIQRGGSLSDAVLSRFGGVTSATLPDGEYWQLVASIFVHRGLAHVLGNTAALLVVGAVAEVLYGRTRLLALFLGSGMAGAATSALFYGPTAVTVGASGGIYGLIGAILVVESVLTPRPPRLDREDQGVASRVAAVQAAGEGLSSGEVAHPVGEHDAGGETADFAPTSEATSAQREIRRETVRDARLFALFALVCGAPAALDPHVGLAAHVGGLVAGSFLALTPVLLTRVTRLKAMSVARVLEGAVFTCAFAMALTWFAPHYGSPGDQARALVDAGVARLRQGDYRAAYEADTRALRIYPEFTAAYQDRGVALFSMGDYRGAITDENRALALDQRNVLAYNLRGLARLRLGDAAGAVADETRALRIFPTLAPAYVSRGLAQAALHDRRAALDDFTRAATLFAKQHDNAAYIQAQAIIAQLQR